VAGAPPELIDKEMWRETYNQFLDAINTGYGDVLWGTPDYLLNQNLKYNAATFAAFKNHAESKEIQKLLTTEGTDGLQPVSWKDFRDKALLISEKYNRRWLQTEYNHATQSSRIARKWQDAQADADLYPNLKYVTAGDERVRHSHKDLNGAIYPINDPFWNTYTPPNGWGCRCSIRPTDQPTKQAAGLPEVPPMFQNNPGKTGNIFPAQNPYAATATAAERKEIEKFVKENVFVPAKTVKEAEDRIMSAGVKSVNLKGLKPDAANAVLKTIESEANFTKLSIDKIETYRSNSYDKALYSASNNSISLNLKNIKKFEQSKVLSYEEQLIDLKRKKLFIEENYMGKPNYKQSTVYARINSINNVVFDIKQKIQNGEVARPHTISSIAKNEFDSISATLQHELGHYHQSRTISKSDYFNFNKKNSISEYGRTNPSEYFSEYYAQFRINGKEGVPDDLLKIFNSIKYDK
jgi:SPP1 gp7 family putative phage head morphogenesis protein